MKLLLLTSLSLVLASPLTAEPRPGVALQLPKELEATALAALATCGGGTGYCSGGTCMCSGFCEGICSWYPCGSC